MKIIKSEIIDYLNRLRYLENKYSNFEENTIYEIWVENLDVDWESKEEEMLGIIYDNKEKDVDEIIAIIREKKIDSVLK